MRAERLLSEFDVEFDVSAYDLRPGLRPEGLPREQAYSGRTYPPGYLDHLRQTALDAGIEMKRPAIIANTHKAHEATEFAREKGQLFELHRAVFDAYWQQERNISQVDVLCDIASQVGLDAAELRQALEDGRYAERVEQQMEWAREMAITGVPTFIFQERFAVVGAQEYEVFRDVARRVLDGRLG